MHHQSPRFAAGLKTIVAHRYLLRIAVAGLFAVLLVAGFTTNVAMAGHEDYGRYCDGYEYVVQKGDTLSEIAKYHGMTYHDLAYANNITDPNYIYKGMKLCIVDGYGHKYDDGYDKGHDYEYKCCDKEHDKYKCCDKGHDYEYKCCDKHDDYGHKKYDDGYHRMSDGYDKGHDYKYKCCDKGHDYEYKCCDKHDDKHKCCDDHEKKCCDKHDDYGHKYDDGYHRVSDGYDKGHDYEYKCCDDHKKKCCNDHEKKCCDKHYDKHEVHHKGHGYGYYYIVKKGDSLSEIAKYHGVSLYELAYLNDISNPNQIYAGMELHIP